MYQWHYLSAKGLGLSIIAQHYLRTFAQNYFHFNFSIVKYFDQCRAKKQRKNDKRELLKIFAAYYKQACCLNTGF